MWAVFKNHQGASAQAVPEVPGAGTEQEKEAEARGGGFECWAKEVGIRRW